MSINEQSAAAPVIIAGAGPTGLTLATELRRGGADVVLLERRPNREVEGSRAAGMQPRTIEMLDQRGIADRFLAEGPPSELGNFAGIKLDYSTLASRFPYALNIMQAETERVLEDVAAELGVAVRWSAEVTGVRQGGGGVEVCVEGPGGAQTVSGSHLVGCDGGRSTVRKLIGAEFPGTDATMACLIGDVKLDEPPRQVPVHPVSPTVHKMLTTGFDPARRMPFLGRLRFTDPAAFSAHWTMVPRWEKRQKAHLG